MPKGVPLRATPFFNFGLLMSDIKTWVEALNCLSEEVARYNIISRKLTDEDKKFLSENIRHKSLYEELNKENHGNIRTNVPS